MFAYEQTPPAERDQMLQAAVLRLLLIEHPAQLTLTELLRELSDPCEGRDKGALETAVGTLVGAGLVHRHGQFLVPSRAALRFDRLPID